MKGMKGKAFQHVDNVKIEIERLLKSSDNSLDPYSQQLLEFIYKQVEPFEEIAQRSLHNHLDEQISSIAKILLGIVERIRDGGVQMCRHELENIKQAIQSTTPPLRMMEELCLDGLYSSFPEEEAAEEEKEECDDVSSKVVGVCDVYKELKDSVLKFPVTSLVGMPGIGKTTLANKIFHDSTVVKHFDHPVWIRIGRKCGVKDIPRRILAEIDPESVTMLSEDDEVGVHECLKENLKSKKYLIVLDDVWDRYMMYFFHPYYRYIMYGLEHPFFPWENGSRILFTSRQQQVNALQNHLHAGAITVRLLNKEESWKLLHEKVFCKGKCPPQLEKAGKKISEICEGLPLTILTVASLLSKVDKSPDYWNEVATKKRHQLFLNAYDEISKVLLPSYTHLPGLLQMCFLYIGLFPQKYEIPRPKLINLWLADGFYELNLNINSAKDVNDCLEELVLNSLVMVYKKSAFSHSHTVKTCGLHSSLWHLSNKKAKETKFALALSSPNDGFGDGIRGHHRLSFHYNVLFAMKDMLKSVEDNCASDARSLLCFGPYHQYQVPICFRLKLLRELDAQSIRFYDFPMEVLQLVELRYLTLTLNGTIPPSISLLSKLQFLVVDRHQSIKSCKDPSYLPMEIWGLKELKHLQIMGSDLPDPCGASLESLSTLLNVSAYSCTEVVLKGIPNLKELKIQIELTPVGDGKLLSCFAHIFHLHILELLKCVIVNPEVVPPIVPFSNFQSEWLTKLSLSGLGYPWKEMSKIALLPFLSVLKLKNYAFQGPNWEVEGGFIHLVSLVIEDTDLVDWKFGCGALINVISLRIRNCYKLEKIHGVFGEYLQNIELVDCNPSCAEEIKTTIPKEATMCVTDVHSSWLDSKLKT
ncbi:hypothetical protein ACS0TY_007025 [Phlomoides rotata]